VFDLIADGPPSNTAVMLACPDRFANTRGCLVRQVLGHTSYPYEESLHHVQAILESSGCQRT
jgi:hypothetical protein